jgi:hypothetical protein
MKIVNFQDEVSAGFLRHRFNPFDECPKSQQKIQKLNRKLTKIVDIAGKLDSGPLVEDEILAGGEELGDHVGHLFSQSRPFARKIFS